MKVRDWRIRNDVAATLTGAEHRDQR